MGALAATGLALLAALAGLEIGRESSGDPPPADRPAAGAVEKARGETRREVTASTFREGYRQGRAAGLRHGQMAGRRTGRTRARVVIAEQELAAAQSEASAAQSELSGMTAAPPVP